MLFNATRPGPTQPSLYDHEGLATIPAPGRIYVLFFCRRLHEYRYIRVP